MQTKLSIRCSKCGQPFTTTIHTVIEVAKEPQAKMALLNGQLNMAQCPNCSTMNAVATPLLYHDSTKELLVAYIPMELNMNKDQQEKAIGDLLKALPKDNFKGYMFNPKRTLTLQGLTDLILQADGVTPEMMESQRQRVELMQKMVEGDDQQLLTLIQENDDKIDLAFFQTFTLMAQRTAQSGRPDLAQRIMVTQQVVIENSTFGQQLIAQQSDRERVVQEIAHEIENLGQEATREDFFQLALKYQDDNDRLQAVVGLIRPVFDYEFFQQLTLTIGQAPSDQRTQLETLRDKLVELTQLVDQQARARLEAAARVLQEFLNASNLEEIVRANISLIDDTFMAVLTANLQEAQRRKDINASARLQGVYDQIMQILQEQMQPELVFVNQLLTAETEQEAQQMLQQYAKQFGDQLLEVMDAVSNVLQAQGEDQVLDRLRALRDQAERVLQN